MIKCSANFMYVAKKRRRTNFNAQKLRKGQSGHNLRQQKEMHIDEEEKGKKREEAKELRISDLRTFGGNGVELGVKKVKETGERSRSRSKKERAKEKLE